MTKYHGPLEAKGSKGQAILIVILIMVVVLTVSLSIASRVITNLKTTGDQANSQKAVAVAEAGIEKAIKAIETNQISSITDDTVALGDGGGTYTVNLKPVEGNKFILENGKAIQKDYSAPVWLSKYAPNTDEMWSKQFSGSLTFYWGDPNLPATDLCTKNAALEVSVISGSVAVPVLDRYVYDGICRSGSNHFTTITGNPSGHAAPSGEKYYYKLTAPVSPISISNGLFAKATVLYNSAKVEVEAFPSGANDLPEQGKIINSVGNYDTTKRSIEVYQPYAWVPDALFPFILYSP